METAGSKAQQFAQGLAERYAPTGTPSLGGAGAKAEDFIQKQIAKMAGLASGLLKSFGSWLSKSVQPLISLSQSFVRMAAAFRNSFLGQVLRVAALASRLTMRALKAASTFFMLTFPVLSRLTASVGHVLAWRDRLLARGSLALKAGRRYGRYVAAEAIGLAMILGVGVASILRQLQLRREAIQKYVVETRTQAFLRLQRTQQFVISQAVEAARWYMQFPAMALIIGRWAGARVAALRLWVSQKLGQMGKIRSLGEVRDFVGGVGRDIATRTNLLVSGIAVRSLQTVLWVQNRMTHSQAWISRTAHEAGDFMSWGIGRVAKGAMLTADTIRAGLAIGHQIQAMTSLARETWRRVGEAGRSILMTDLSPMLRDEARDTYGSARAVYEDIHGDTHAEQAPRDPIGQEVEHRRKTPDEAETHRAFQDTDMEPPPRHLVVESGKRPASTLAGHAEDERASHSAAVEMGENSSKHGFQSVADVPLTGRERPAVEGEKTLKESPGREPRSGKPVTQERVTRREVEEPALGRHSTPVAPAPALHQEGAASEPREGVEHAAHHVTALDEHPVSGPTLPKRSAAAHPLVDSRAPSPPGSGLVDLSDAARIMLAPLPSFAIMASKALSGLGRGVVRAAPAGTDRRTRAETGTTMELLGLGASIGLTRAAGLATAGAMTLHEIGQAFSPIVQRSGPRDTSTFPNAEDLQQDLVRKEGEGQVLPKELRAHLGTHLGFDPSNARVHSGPEAARAAREMGAEAFTIGQDVFFGAGRFEPATTQGRALLIHELTHVRQQAKGLHLLHGVSAERESGELEEEARHASNLYLATPARAPGLQVEHFERCYEPEERGNLTEQDQAHLDQLSTEALEQAGHLLGRHDQNLRLDEVHVSLDVDLRSMTDRDIVDAWCQAIVAAINHSASGTHAQTEAPGPVAPILQTYRRRYVRHRSPGVYFHPNFIDAVIDVASRETEEHALHRGAEEAVRRLVGRLDPVLAGLAVEDMLHAFGPLDPDPEFDDRLNSVFRFMMSAQQRQEFRARYIAEQVQQVADRALAPLGDQAAATRDRESQRSEDPQTAQRQPSAARTGDHAEPGSRDGVDRDRRERFLNRFEGRAMRIAYDALNQAREQINAEEHRLLGPGSRQAREELARIAHRVALASQIMTDIRMRRYRMGRPVEGGFERGHEAFQQRLEREQAQERYDALGRDIERLTPQYNRLLAQARRQSVILRAFDDQWSLAGASRDLQTVGHPQEQRLRALFREKREAIDTVHNGLLSGRYKIWKNPELVQRAKDDLGVTEGSIENFWVDQEVEQVAMSEAGISFLASVITMTFAILATAATAGGAAPVAAAALSGTTAALGVAQTAQDIEQYGLERAATQTHFDPSQALSHTPPSAFWLGVSIVGNFADAAEFLGAVGRLARPVNAAVEIASHSGEAISAVRRAEILGEVRSAARAEAEQLAAHGHLNGSVDSFVDTTVQTAERHLDEASGGARPLGERHAIVPPEPTEPRAAAGGGAGHEPPHGGGGHEPPSGGGGGGEHPSGTPTEPDRRTDTHWPPQDDPSRRTRTDWPPQEHPHPPEGGGRDTIRQTQPQFPPEHRPSSPPAGSQDIGSASTPLREHPPAAPVQPAGAAEDIGSASTPLREHPPAAPGHPAGTPADAAGAAHPSDRVPHEPTYTSEQTASGTYEHDRPASPPPAPVHSAVPEASFGDLRRLREGTAAHSPNSFFMTCTQDVVSDSGEVIARSGRRYIFKEELQVATGPQRWHPAEVISALAPVPTQYSPRAVATSILGAEVGVETPATRLVTFRGVRGTLQEVAEASPGGRIVSMAELHRPPADLPAAARQADRAIYDRLVRSEEYRRAFEQVEAFDYIVNNMDRGTNVGNYLVELGPDGEFRRLIPIDHDLTLPPVRDRVRYSQFSHEHGAYVEGFTSGLPRRYSRRMIERVRELIRNRAALSRRLAEFLDERQIEGVFHRAQEIIDDSERAGAILDD